MTTSFQEIASLLDPASPPASINDLISAHRWVGGAPPALRSLQSVMRRHSHPQTTLHRFLSYNTYLLDGFAIPWDEFILGNDLLETLLGAFGITPRKVIETLGPQALLKALGVDIPIPPLVDDVIGFILDMSGIGPTAAVVAIAKKVTPPTKILKLFGINLPAGVGAKPKLDERGPEIGQALTRAHEVAPNHPRHYDIMALSEVFREVSRASLLEAFSGQPVDAAAGPDSSGLFVLQSSGLFVMTVARPIVHSQTLSHVYETRGDRLRDSDAWANKGVLRTVIDTGTGFIELYSTHTISGGDFSFLKSATHEEFVQLRLAQLNELMSLYQQHHNPANVCIITGDFNINGKNAADYEALRSFMDGFGFEDIWFRQNSAALERATHSTEDPVQHDIVCVSDPFGSPNPYCQPFATLAANDKECLDYIFVEKPTAQHVFNLDVSRVQRVPFRRETTEDIAFLSDHIGLETTLIASPRT